MKRFKIDIAPELKDVEVIVKNGRLFTEKLMKGEYTRFHFTTNEEDAKRIKQFAVKFGNDNRSCRGNWHAHCNGYAMDLLVTSKGTSFSINTYRPYGQAATGMKNYGVKNPQLSDYFSRIQANG